MNLVFLHLYAFNSHTPTKPKEVTCKVRNYNIYYLESFNNIQHFAQL